MVARYHCHYFIEDFFDSVDYEKMGLNTHNKYDVQRGIEAQNLDL